MDTLNQTLTFSMTQFSTDEGKTPSVVCTLSVTSLEPATGKVNHTELMAGAALATTLDILQRISAVVIGAQTVCGGCGAEYPKHNADCPRVPN